MPTKIAPFATFANWLFSARIIYKKTVSDALLTKNQQYTKYQRSLELSLLLLSCDT